MDRAAAFLDMLSSSAKMQEHIASILEAKAYEAEKARSWVCTSLHESTFTNCDEIHKTTLLVHDSIVEVIEGITKMELGLAKNLNIVLGDQEGDSAGGFPDFFGGAGDDA